MTGYELYELALSKYKTDGYRRWLLDQPDDTLCRLYTGLTEYRDRTLVVRTTADLERAETHEGPVVFRDCEPKDWFEHCDNLCILDDVTDVLGQRLHALAFSDDRDMSGLAERPEARQVLSEWVEIVQDRVGRNGSAGIDITYAGESRFVRTCGMERHGLPELGIRDVPRFLVGPVRRFLREVCDQVLARPAKVRLGEMMAISNGTQFRFVPADPPGADEYRPSQLWRLADVGESYLGCEQCGCADN
ncbi:hypothetical protein J0H58_16530 [bacterium]|nr:hypothetical protein [bacterium]